MAAGHVPLRTNKDACESCKPLSLGIKVFYDTFKPAHGVVFGVQVRRIPVIPYAQWALLLRWNRRDRADYSIRVRRPDVAIRYTAEQVDNYSTFMLYSFDHCEDLDKQQLPEDPDWSDITMIDWPDDLSDISVSIPGHSPPRDPPDQPPQRPPFPPLG